MIDLYTTHKKENKNLYVEILFVNYIGENIQNLYLFIM